jgi:transposase
MVSTVPNTRPAYPPEFRREAVRMLRAGRTPRELAQSLGVSEHTPRNWRRQEQADRHERDDVITSDERDELRWLRRENARLKQERDLLKRAAAFSAAENERRCAASAAAPTISVLGVRVADDLVEHRFRPDRPNVLWVADVSRSRRLRWPSIVAGARPPVHPISDLQIAVARDVVTASRRNAPFRARRRAVRPAGRRASTRSSSTKTREPSFPRRAANVRQPINGNLRAAAKRSSARCIRSVTSV